MGSNETWRMVTNHLVPLSLYHVMVKEITGTLTLLVLLAYGLGISVAEKCLFISHGLGRDSYSKGMDDIFFIGFWVVAFTFLRAASMLYLYHPLAKVLGVSPLAKRQRLAEQGFVFTYSATFWTLGMVRRKCKRGGGKKRWRFLFLFCCCCCCCCSISCTVARIGSILHNTGLITLTCTRLVPWSTTTWCKCPFGSSNSTLSILKNDERIISRWWRIILSPSPSWSLATLPTFLGLEMQYCVVWIWLISSCR